MKTLGLVMLIAIVAVSCSSQESQPPATAVVVLETTAGNITLELAGDKAPITVKNFLQYVDEGHYNGTIFHRVKADFMIQGGGYTPDGKEKRTRAPIRNEGGNGLRSTVGTIAMARTNAPDSATSQVVINVADNGFLDRDQARDGYGYAVFGKVIGGMDVVDKIKAMPVHPNVQGELSEPDKPVVILKAYRK